MGIYKPELTLQIRFNSNPKGLTAIDLEIMKGHDLQMVQQHKQVQRISRQGPEAEMFVEALCPFIFGMDSQHADAGNFCSHQRADDRILQEGCAEASWASSSMRSGACSMLTSPTTSVWNPATASAANTM